MNDRLYRSVDDRVLAGVCGGLAVRLAVDPSLVRIGYAIVALLTGIFPLLILYVIMAAVVPEEPTGFAGVPRSPAPPGPDAVPGWTPPARPPRRPAASRRRGPPLPPPGMRRRHPTGRLLPPRRCRARRRPPCPRPGRPRRGGSNAAPAGGTAIRSWESSPASFSSAWASGSSCGTGSRSTGASSGPSVPWRSGSWSSWRRSGPGADPRVGDRDAPQQARRDGAAGPPRRLDCGR